MEVGQYPVNSVALDRSGMQAVCASDDGSVKVVDLRSYSVLGALAGHESAVQCVAVAPNDSCVISGSSDATFKLWGK